MKTLILSALLLLSSATAADLRIYSSFSEVREPRKLIGSTLDLSFTPEAMGLMVPNSLYLEGVKVLSQNQTVNQAKGWLEAYEGKTVFLLEGDKSTEVKLIRASDGTVQDLKTGRFRTGISASQLEFSDLPQKNEQGSTNFKFLLGQTSGDATVSYLSRGISWSPRYVMNVKTDGSVKMDSLADIRNGTTSSVAVNTSELIAGQVDLSDNGPRPYPTVNYQMQKNAGADQAAEAPSIGEGLEGAGIYSFPLNKSFELSANSSYSLPFLEPKLSLERFAALKVGFNPSYSKGKFNRLYRFKSDSLLPAGIITVRDEGRVVGQGRLSDVAVNEISNLTLGADPDISYVRSVKIIEQTKTSVKYQINLTVSSSKAREVNLEYVEQFDGSNITLEGKADRTDEGLKISAKLPAKGKLERSYTLKFIYQ
jgi:hypothetical protein